ncbi:hypothetical protein [Mucilaginibacter sp.]|uniref:hypothetical protein n=1 Tax=Mucilaginibacter sp. TaxID=1882438 RepID=UPI000CA76606|nr:hypothetical protein [Mucilaginibacter sp.]PLW90445.1 MAG: hypothetical protein C0154_06360 [Mucilaginibacter sp.]HEK20433.1 hypothetical protein [Bacteroidota bacterium]
MKRKFLLIAVFTFLIKITCYGQLPGVQTQDQSTLKLYYGLNGPPANYSEGATCTFHLRYESSADYIIISVNPTVFSGIALPANQPELVGISNQRVGAYSYDCDVTIKYHGFPATLNVATYRRYLINSGLTKRNDWSFYN